MYNIPTIEEVLNFNKKGNKMSEKIIPDEDGYYRLKLGSIVGEEAALNLAMLISSSTCFIGEMSPPASDKDYINIHLNNTSHVIKDIDVKQKMFSTEYEVIGKVKPFGPWANILQCVIDENVIPNFKMRGFMENNADKDAILVKLITWDLVVE